MKGIDEIRERARRVRLLALDVDGVLTDGGVYVGDDGSEFRRFDIKDGLGIQQLVDHGYTIVVISSGACQAVKHRMKKFGVTEIHLAVVDKLEKMTEVCQRFGIDLEQVCYIGDDLPDLRLMERVGLSCAPSDAHGGVVALVDCVCNSSGGKGCVREICDLLFSLSLAQSQ